MRGANSRQTRNAVVRLTAITALHVFSSRSSIRIAPGIGGKVFFLVTTAGPPATFTRKSGAPIFPASFSTSSASVRSAAMIPAAGWMSVATTSTCSCRSRSAMEEPIPLAAPVTRALLPFSPSSGIGGAVDVERDAGHVGGVLGAQRHDQRGTFIHCPHAPHRDSGQRPLGSALLARQRHHTLQPPARNHTGRDAVHAHAE